jgi:3'-phosphoadenosine 5'-phosphosulfate sulfotransferase (PAPS reductase)/FAD synthetase
VKHIVNLSGGKDSTAMLLMMLEKNMPIDYIVFADTGKDFPQMIEHLKELENYIQQHYPNAPKITYVKHPKGFDYMMFEHKKCRGKYQDTLGCGWASFRNRWCTSRLKIDIINKFCKSLDDVCMHYIGVAFDEPKRIKNGNFTYPLYDWKVTEKQALQYCYDKGFNWGGLYKHFDRVSCWCCPLQPIKALKSLYINYPNLWSELKEMDSKSCSKFRADYSVLELEEKFKKEGAR